MEELIAQSEAFDQDKADFRLRANGLQFAPNGKLAVVGHALPYDDSTPQRQFGDPAHHMLSVTDDARTQLHLKLGPTHYGVGSNKSLPTEYLSKLPPDIYATILNHTLSQSDAMWKVRTYKDNARAFLDGNYPRVWNTEVLRQLERTLEDRNGLDGLNWNRSWVNEDELCVRLWWKDSGTPHYAVGLMITNGEVGNRAFTGYPMIRRHSCENSIAISNISHITGQAAGFRLVHYRGASAEAMMIQFYAQLPALINASGELINKMVAAEGVVIPDFRQVLNGLAIENGWNAQLLDIVDEGTEGQRTVAGLVNGITFAAHQAPRLSESQRTSMELIGGNHLFSTPQDFAGLVRLAEKKGRVFA